MGEGLPAGVGMGSRGTRKPLLTSESTGDVQRIETPPLTPQAPQAPNDALWWKARDQESWGIQSVDVNLQGHRAVQRMEM